MLVRFIALILTFYLLPAVAQEVAPVPESEELRRVAECGMDDGKVIPLDGTLCRDDIAFGMMYDFFPSVYNELIPFWGLSMFSTLGSSPNVPESAGQYNGEDVMMVLYEMLYDIIIWVIIAVVGLLVLHYLLRLIRGDSIFGDDSDDKTKDDTQSLAVGMGSAALFLLSLKNVIVGMLVIFSLSMFSLTIANSISSYFLSSIQLFYEKAQDENGVVRPLPGVVDRHTFSADHYYRTLTRLQLCRMQSASYGLTSAAVGYANSGDYLKGANCQYGDDRVEDKRKVDGADVPAFIDRRSSSVSNDAWYQFSTDELVFGVNPRMHSQCRIEPVSLPDYECGTLDIASINWGENPLIQMLDSPEALVSVLSSMGDTLSGDSSPNTIKTVTREAWTELKSKLDEAYEELDEQFSNMDAGTVILDNRVVTKKEAFQMIQDETRRPYYEDVIRKLSQYAINLVMFGQHDRFVYEQATFEVMPNFDGIVHHSNIAEELAGIVREGHCYDSPKNIVDAVSTSKYMRGEISSLPASSLAKCIDFNTKEVLGYPIPWSTMPPKEASDAAKDKFNEIKGRFQVQWDVAVSGLSQQRWAAEEIFMELVGELAPENWWKRMRQRGYLAAPDYVQKAIDKNQRMGDNLAYLTDNFDASNLRYNSFFMDQLLVTNRDIEDRFTDFRYAGSEILDATNLNMNKLDPLIDRSDWVSSKQQYLRQGTIPLATTWMEELFSILPSSKHILTRLGISASANDKNKQACLTDPSKCPFPLTDPLVELSLVGHDILDVGITVYLMAIPVKGINELRALDGKRGTGTISAKSSFYKKIGSSMGYLSFAGEAAGKALGLFDFVFDILSNLMIFFIVIGAAMAYLLPFLPKLFMYLNFVSWGTIVIMASFGVMLWSVYLLRMNENKEQLKSAGMHFSVQILLRPSFNLIGVIFAIVFFYVVAYLIGITAWWMNAIPAGSSYFDTNILRFFTDSMIVISIFAFLYYVGIKTVFELISEIESTMLIKFGVKAGPSQGSLNNVVKAIVFDKMRHMSSKMNSFLDGRGVTKSQFDAAQDLMRYSQELNHQTKAMNETNKAKKDGV